MPIRLNLLAEAQAEEELRRRDPVKRAIWAGSLLVTGMLVWSGALYLKSLAAKRGLGAVQAQIAQRSNDFRVVQDNRRQADDFGQKLQALNKLAASRFLHGNLLNALQQVALEDVQLLRLKVDQSYALIPETPARTNTETKRVTPAQPAGVKESILVTLEARDAGPEPGDQVNKYRDALGTNAYFHAALSKTNAVRLAYRSPVATVPGARSYLNFTLECRYPEISR